MDVANEILDAIEIIVDKKIKEQTTQIYPGICKSVNGNSCVMSINGKDNTVQFYGSAPIVGTIYRVFVPYGNMPMAFIITANGSGSFAPAGYGIGEEYAARVNDTNLDTLKKGGTYYIGTGCTNTPPNTDTAWSTLHVIPGRACTQFFIPANDANRAGTFTSWIARIYNNETNVWGSWEWVNPPMKLGVEYRTTERYLGKPVYVKTVPTGAMPAAAGTSNRVTIQTSIPASDVDIFIRFEGLVTNGTMSYTLPVGYGNATTAPDITGYLYKYADYVVICQSSYDMSEYSGTLTFWYTKTTD